jgi:hypothetical protein
MLPTMGFMADEHDHDHGAGQVDAREDPVLAQPLPEGAGGIGADDVEQADERQGRGGDFGAELLVFEVTGQVDADEGDLEAADKVARGQQQEVAVTEGVAQGGRGRLGWRRAGVGGGLRGFAQAESDGADEQGGQGQGHQGGRPVHAVQQGAGQGHHEELAKRAGCRGDAHGPGALLGADVAADDAVDDRVGAAGLRQADGDARGQQEGQVLCGGGHAEQAERVEDATGPQGLERAAPVGPPAHKGAGCAPDQVLQCQGQGKVLSRPAVRHGDGLQPQPEGVADAHGEGDDDGATQQQLHQWQGTGGRGHGRQASVGLKPACS